MANGGSSGFGPGLWVVDIEKMYLGEYWTNRYIVAASDLAGATTIGGTIMGLEKTVHQGAALFTRYRVSDGQPLTDVYQVVQVNAFGEKPGTNTSYLPLFNVIRCDFNTAGGGRPSRKYLRGILTEADVAFNNIEQACIDYLTTNYVNPLVGLAGFVDVDNQQITSGSVYPNVSMRQLRRASKRKAPAAGTPV
jgi:hypothetical protein